MMVEIKSRQDLERWLDGQPREFAQVIAARVALRVLPLAFHAHVPDKLVSHFSHAMFRSAAISWAARNLGEKGVMWPVVAAAAASAALPAVKAASFDARNAASDASVAESDAKSALSDTNQAVHDVKTASSDYIASSAVGRAASAENKSRAAANRAEAAAFRAYGSKVAAGTVAVTNCSLAATSSVTDALKARVAAVAAVTEGSRFVDDPAAIWRSVSADCEWLSGSGRFGLDPVQILSGTRLWLVHPPNSISNVWQEARYRLAALDSKYYVWIDWYDRRIKGENSGFSISRDADEGLQVRIFDQTDEWWDRGHAAVNADIAAWLEEAKAQIEQEVDQATESIELPPQNPNSLTFKPSPSGRIFITLNAGNHELQRDAAAQDRHTEALDEARRLLELARGSNAGQRLVGPLERYIAALGDNIDDLKPGITAQRGERLRQYLADYETEAQDPDLEPLPREVLNGLKAVRSAHNVMMAVDPLLRQMDSALLGPDVKPALITPEDLKSMAADADEADMLEPGVREILEEAANLSPAIPDPANRRSVWSGEMALNLTIELWFIARFNPIKTTASVAGVAGIVVTSNAIAISTGFTALGLIGFALAFSQWAKKREAGLLALLERYPACQAMLRDLLAGVMPEDKDRKPKG